LIKLTEGEDQTSKEAEWLPSVSEK
jgi:hypothetical protein